jgi:hypothetical protein
VSVTVHIERIVVEGLPLSPRDRVALGDAVQQELKTLLGAHAAAWPARDVRVRRVAGGPLAMAPGRPVAAVGAQIAGAIDAGIGTAVPR